MAEKHVRRCSTSLLIREMHTNITTRHQLTAARTAVLKKTGDSRCWRGCGKKKTMFTVNGNANWSNDCGKQFWTFLRKTK